MKLLSGVIEKYVYNHNGNFENQGIVVSAIHFGSNSRFSSSIRENHSTNSRYELEIERQYRKRSVEFIDYFDGAFSIVIVDKERGKVFLFVDREATCSLYYGVSSQGLLFASVAADIAKMDKGFSTPDIYRISRLIIERGSYNSDDDDLCNTIYKKIKKVPAGHYVEFDLRDFGRQRIVKYYDVERVISPLRLKTRQEYEEAYLCCISDAVRAAMSDNVTVVSSLSSGFDSAVVSCIAANELKKQGKRLTAYTAAPIDCTGLETTGTRLIDEYPLARQIAEFNGNIDLHRYHDSNRNAYRVIDESLDWLDTPIYNFCNTDWVFGLKKHAVSHKADVFLEASMGNLVISNGSYFRAVNQLLRSSKLNGAFKLLINIISANNFTTTAVRKALSPFKAYLLHRRDEIQHAPTLWRDLCGSAQKLQNLSSNSDTMEEYIRNLLRMTIYYPHASSVLQMYKAGMLIRDPLRNHRVFEFALSISPEQWGVDFFDRSLIRRSSVGLLPDSKRLSNTRGVQGADWLKKLQPDWSNVLYEARIALENDQINILADREGFLKCIERNLELNVFDYNSRDVRDIMQLVVLNRFFDRLE